MIRKFRRDIKNGEIGGVCAGIANYLHCNLTLIRLIFVFGTIITCINFILIYLLIWVFTPEI